jgi:hypothetical protein
VRWFRRQAEGDIFAHGHMRKERVALENLIHVAPVRRQLRDVFAAEQHGADVGRLKAGDHAKQRGFATAGRTEQREELAHLHGERDIVDRGEGAETLGDAAEFDHGGNGRRGGTHATPPWVAAPRRWSSQ